MKPSIVYDSDPAMLFATLGNVFFAIVRDEMVASRVAVMREHELALARAVGSNLVVFTVIDVPEAKVFAASAEGRTAAANLTREMAGKVRCNAIVLDQKGFAASALRSIVTAIGILTKSTTASPMRMFDSDDAAIDWILPHLDVARFPGLGRATVQAAVATLRGAAARSTG